MMGWSSFKYLLAYIAPIGAFWGIWMGGIWSAMGVYIGFGVIPLLEIISPRSSVNIAPQDEPSVKSQRFFDWLLYLNVPILFGLIGFYIWRVLYTAVTPGEMVGMVASLGVIMGTEINVAHELGHRTDRLSQWLAKLILIPAMYNHFTLEHNLGHHKNVGTREDPATSRLNESIYAFWMRCIPNIYKNAWSLQMKQLKGKSFFSQKNMIFWSHVVQAIYLLTMFLIGGWILLVSALGIALVGILLLESVDYIEHYGLMRKKLPSGQYERVETFHSWNANHEVGRIFLYELTRHADHHYKSTRPYQILRHWDQSPQLPYGYPLSIMMSMIPPLWFRQMNPLVKSWANRQTIGVA